MRVLVVDEVRENGQAMVAALRAVKIKADALEDGGDALAFAADYSPQAALLACVEGGPLELLRQARRRGVTVPVLVVAETLEVSERVELFNSGADDVVTRETCREELIARLRSVARRGGNVRSSVLTLGRLVVDLDKRHLYADGGYLHLTPLEFAFVELLVLRQGAVVARAAMMDHFYGGRDGPAHKIVDVICCRTRAKFRDAGLPDAIRTVWGRGFQLCVPNDVN